MTLSVMEAAKGTEALAFDETIAAMKDNPGTAAFQFRSRSQWKQGAVVVSTFDGYARDGADVARRTPHTLGADEPPALLGTGTEVGPTGHLLHALSHLLVVTMVQFAAVRRVELHSLEVDAWGTLDLQGLLGLDERVMPGFKQIHLDVRVDSPSGPPARVCDVLEYALARSPVANTITHPVPIDWLFDVDTVEGAPDTGEIRHGVNIADLTAAVTAIQAQPVLGRCRFYTSSEWLGGARVRSSSPGFDQAEGVLLIEHRDPQPKGYTGDYVPELLGTDTSVMPEEALLKAMASCLSVTTSYHAAARGIRLEALDVDLEGHFDMRGLADVDDRVSPGCQQFVARVAARAGGTLEGLRDLVTFATSHSPMCNSVARPVALAASLTCNGQPV